jgi:hypothetical protein
LLWNNPESGETLSQSTIMAGEKKLLGIILLSLRASTLTLSVEDKRAAAWIRGKAA